jgi:hypothetical protein
LETRPVYIRLSIIIDDTIHLLLNHVSEKETSVPPSFSVPDRILYTLSHDLDFGLQLDTTACFRCLLDNLDQS